MSRWLVFMPWALLLAFSLYLSSLYPEFPARWPIHWDAHGQINGWADKTPMGAAFPLLIGGSLALIFEAMARVLGAVSNSSLPPPWAERMKESNQGFLRFISLCCVLLMGYLACRLPFGAPSVFSVGVFGVACISYPLLATKGLLDEMRRQGALPAGYDGLLYKDPEDPRLWVPKLSGLGYTLNMAHPQARRWALFFLLLPVVALVVPWLLASRN